MFLFDIKVANASFNEEFPFMDSPVAVSPKPCTSVLHYCRNKQPFENIFSSYLHYLKFSTTNFSKYVFQIKPNKVFGFRPVPNYECQKRHFVQYDVQKSLDF